MLQSGFLPCMEGGKKKAKKAPIKVSRYILMYAWYSLMNSVVYQISRERSFF